MICTVHGPKNVTYCLVYQALQYIYCIKIVFVWWIYND